MIINKTNIFFGIGSILIGKIEHNTHGEKPSVGISLIESPEQFEVGKQLDSDRVASINKDLNTLNQTTLHFCTVESIDALIKSLEELKPALKACQEMKQFMDSMKDMLKEEFEEQIQWEISQENQEDDAEAKEPKE